VVNRFLEKEVCREKKKGFSRQFSITSAELRLRFRRRCQRNAAFVREAFLIAAGEPRESEGANNGGDRQFEGRRVAATLNESGEAGCGTSEAAQREVALPDVFSEINGQSLVLVEPPVDCAPARGSRQVWALYEN